MPDGLVRLRKILEHPFPALRGKIRRRLYPLSLHECRSLSSDAPDLADVELAEEFVDRFPLYDRETVRLLPLRSNLGENLGWRHTHRDGEVELIRYFVFNFLRHLRVRHLERLIESCEISKALVDGIFLHVVSEPADNIKHHSRVPDVCRIVPRTNDDLRESFLELEDRHATGNTESFGFV